MEYIENQNLREKIILIINESVLKLMIESKENNFELVYNTISLFYNMFWMIYFLILILIIKTKRKIGLISTK